MIHSSSPQAPSSLTVEPILSLTGIDKAFPGVKALNQAGLNVYPGQVMALMGENGAGKSTLIKVLTGIMIGAVAVATADKVLKGETVEQHIPVPLQVIQQ